MAERRCHTSRGPTAVLEKCKTPVGMRDRCRLCHFASNTAHVQRRKGIHNHRHSIYARMIISAFNFSNLSIFAIHFSVFFCGVLSMF